MPFVVPERLRCCVCDGRTWSEPGRDLELSLSRGFGRTCQWFGVHESCLMAALGSTAVTPSDTPRRSCPVCEQEAATFEHLLVAVGGLVDRVEFYVHDDCLQKKLASGFLIET